MDHVLEFGEITIEFDVINEGLVNINLMDAIDGSEIKLELTDFELGQLIGSLNVLVNK